MNKHPLKARLLNAMLPILVPFLAVKVAWWTAALIAFVGLAVSYFTGNWSAFSRSGSLIVVCALALAFFDYTTATKQFLDEVRQVFGDQYQEQARSDVQKLVREELKQYGIEKSDEKRRMTLNGVCRRRQALRACRRHRRPPAGRCRHRQRAAGPRERRVPGGAGGARRSPHRPPRTLHRRRLGRRGAAAPTQDRQPRADRAADGARRRRRRRRLHQHPFGRLGDRAARSRSRRRVHRSVPRSRAHAPTAPPSSAVAWRAGTSPIISSSAAAKRGSVGRAHPGCSLRIVDPDLGTALGTDEVGLLEVPRRRSWAPTSGCAPPTSPASTPTASSGSWDAPTRRSSGAGTRCSPKWSRAALERDPAVVEASVVGRARRPARCGAGGGGRTATRARHRREDPPGGREPAPRAATRYRSRSSWSTNFLAPRRGRPISPRCARCSTEASAPSPWDR